MNFSQKSYMVFISIPILYLLHLPGIVCPKNKSSPKLKNLPLVLLKQQNNEYTFPRCFRRDLKSDQVFFTTADDEEQVFFCPRSSEERLLFPTHGINYHCKKQPEPTIRKITSRENNCGEGRDLYSFAYKLPKPGFDKKLPKPESDEKNDTYNWKEIYSFCFDKKRRQVIYVKYRILSPNLLGNRQLQRERSYYEVEYRLEDFDDESIKLYINLIMTALDKEETRKFFTTMELGHPADMIFPNWKKPFYHAVNKGLLLNTLKNQWRKVGHFVRKLAQKKLGEIDIVTGTLPVNRKELFGTFWKLVIYKKQAIAIILHNIYLPPDQNDADKTPKNKTNADDNPKQETKPDDKPKPETKAEKRRRKKTKAQDEPAEKTNVSQDPTNVADAQSKSVTGHRGSKKKTMQTFCTDICLETGFQGIISKELEIPAYCCDPKVITDLLGWEEYGLLNLKKTPRDSSVIDDGCPKDPVQIFTPESKTLTEGLNKMEDDISDLEKNQLLDLKNTPTDPSVIDDGRPKDPIQTSTSENLKNTLSDQSVIESGGPKDPKQTPTPESEAATKDSNKIEKS